RTDRQIEHVLRFAVDDKLSQAAAGAEGIQTGFIDQDVLAQQVHLRNDAGDLALVAAAVSGTEAAILVEPVAQRNAPVKRADLVVADRDAELEAALREQVPAERFVVQHTRV